MGVRRRRTRWSHAWIKEGRRREQLDQRLVEQRREELAREPALDEPACGWEGGAAPAERRAERNMLWRGVGTSAGVGFVVPTGLIEQLGGGLVYDAAGKGVAPTLDEEGVGPHLTQRVALLLEQLGEA